MIFRGKENTMQLKLAYDQNSNYHLLILHSSNLVLSQDWINCLLYEKEDENDIAGELQTNSEEILWNEAG